MNIESLRVRCGELLAPEHRSDRLSLAVNFVLVGLIATNILALVLDSMAELHNEFGAYFALVESVSVVIFTIEYFARLWTASPRVTGRLRAALRPMLLVDLLAIVPFYVPFFAADLQLLRAIRLLRVLRILRLGRYSAAIRRLARTMRDSGPELVATVSVGFILMLLAAAGIYHAESEAQPEIFSSIPASMWWAVITLTTVGYGDAYPVTTVGKMLGALIATLGIGLFALPTAILGNAFMRAFGERALEQNGAEGQEGLPEDPTQPGHCPHCKQPLPKKND